MDRVQAYADAFLEVARAEGHLTDIEDELYRFARVYAGSDDLRMALTDPALPAEERVAIIDDLLGRKALAATLALVTMVVTAGRIQDLPQIVDRFVEQAAQLRDHEVAEVHSAVPLTPQQERRLAEALSTATGKQVELKVVIDTSVMGGLVARVGDVVIDGSVRNRLDQIRKQRQI
jgi:F-type H+-transporting ATPase subunit delta